MAFKLLKWAFVDLFLNASIIHIFFSIRGSSKNVSSAKSGVYSNEIKSRIQFFCHSKWELWEIKEKI